MNSDFLTRRTFLKSLGLGGLALTLPRLNSAFGLDRRDPARPPNFVFILIDDLGWKDVACFGGRAYTTPNIDRLAAQGVSFTNAYANAPVCTPSRACLLSGQYSPRHGIYTVTSRTPLSTNFYKLIPTPTCLSLDSRFTTIAEALHSKEYVCASIGKWHLGEGPETGPEGQGFDVTFGGGQWGRVQSHFSPYGYDAVPNGPDGEYLTDRLTNEAVRFMETHADRPFFLYLSHYAVHEPIQAKRDLIARHQNQKTDVKPFDPAYAAMIDGVDESVGRVLETLERLKLADNTVVIFFSDNGPVQRHSLATPLRGSKWTLYEGGIRVPLIVRWPGKAAAGRICDTPVIGTDFYPTLLEMAGAARPENTELDGVSLAGLLQGGALAPRPLFWHFPEYKQGYRGNNRLDATPCCVMRFGDWKLFEFFEDGRLELYNLADDPGEQHDLAEQRKEKAAELHRMMLKWRERVKAPVPTELNPHYKPSVPAASRPADPKDD